MPALLENLYKSQHGEHEQHEPTLTQELAASRLVKTNKVQLSIRAIRRGAK